jgi:hypothetical protein
MGDDFSILIIQSGFSGSLAIAPYPTSGKSDRVSTNFLLIRFYEYSSELHPQSFNLLRRNINFD